MLVRINYTIEEISVIIGGILVQKVDHLPLQYILLDSRKVVFPEHTLFFALQNRRDGHAFVGELYSKGVRSFVVNDAFEYHTYPDAAFITVKDTLRSLHELASHHRQQFDIPVIGIAGSNGKTIVKEWLNQLLEDKYNIVRSPRSYNSQIGVPLSVLHMSSSHNLGIFEAGISMTGEMNPLEYIIMPTIGILTHAGEAHNEGFKGMKEKIAEKLFLFSRSEVLIYNGNNQFTEQAVKEVVTNTNRGLELFKWGTDDDCKLQIIGVEKKTSTTLITGKYLEKAVEFEIPFIDEAAIENAISCWCTLLLLGLDGETIRGKIMRLIPVQMRLELKQGINECLIINDSYSADLDSLATALDFLAQQAGHDKRTVILSDILQTGKAKEELYSDVAGLMMSKKINRLIGIGNDIKSQAGLFTGIQTSFFATVNDLLISKVSFNNEAILLKGARVFEFEKILQLLELKVHQTILSINLSSIIHNLNVYREQLHHSTKIMAMVKAFSYGSGTHEIAGVLAFHKMDYLAVAYADEGVELRKAGITLPIMVMNPEVNTFHALVEYSLEPEIFSFELLHSFERYVQSAGVDFFPVHIKLDTGMHRLGFAADDIESLGNQLHQNKRLKVVSVFSHLVASEDAASDPFTLKQRELFERYCSKLQEIIGYDFIRHIANTEAITRHPQLQFDMVRLGIGLYGIDTEQKMQEKLKTVGTLTTTIAQIKPVKKGESVGYGRKAFTDRDSIIAIVRIGYADGYPRSLSNGVGKMLVGRLLAPVIGNVCMDMTMLDITDIEGVNEGDHVVVFGDKLSIAEVARWDNTIPYEIMTGVSQRVKRVYYEE